MITKKKKKYKLLQKKLIRLRVNPLNNSKYLELAVVLKKKINQRFRPPIIIRRFAEIAKNKKKKWETFIRLLVKANKFFQKYKPYTFHHYDVSKFASPGNSHKKKFRKDLFIKKIFNHYYGGLKNKFLKKQMTKIFMSKQIKTTRNVCIEFFESRLDSVLHRTKFCLSIKDAKQLINHKHIYVNNKIENNYSYILKQGDLVQVITTKARKIIRNKLKHQFKERFDLILWPVTPDYVSVNYKTLDIVFGDTKNFNFSTTFNFKNDNRRVMENHYRH